MAPFSGRGGEHQQQRLPTSDSDLDESEMEGLVNVNLSPTPSNVSASNTPPYKKKSGSFGSRPVRTFITIVVMLAVLSALVYEQSDNHAITKGGGGIGSGGKGGSTGGGNAGDDHYDDEEDDDDDGENDTDDPMQDLDDDIDDDTEDQDQDQDKDSKGKDTDGQDKKEDDNQEDKKEEDQEATVIHNKEPLTKEELIEKWGKWHFWDGAEEMRPKEDYMAPYPNKDCPFDKFPETAWQGDAVYVNHFLDSGSELVSRAKEAIYTEYGWGPRKQLEMKQVIQRLKMFKLHYLDFDKDPDVKNPPEESKDSGGWTTKKSFQGLSKRLLHAMMTNDDFTVVLGGHSAAAGHGNHFLQSYMMEFHKILEPIFTRLGMNLITRNIAHGGLGTMQNALGSGSLYGDAVDIMVWDSSMTEPHNKDIDLFCRQALIGGKRPPVLYGAHFPVLKDLAIHADADVLDPGSGMVGIPITENRDQVKTLPFATQYMKCPHDNRDLCDDKQHRFRTTCWVDRDDVDPPTKQADAPPSQVSWHPGFRVHQLKARVLAFSVLEALQDAIDTWSEITIFAGHPLPDQYWHITDHYDNIQNKAKNLSSDIGECTSLKDVLPERVCTTPLKGRTEFTPRANPNETSITSILKPAPNGYIPALETKMAYEGPDVPNPSLEIPEGEVDVRTIVSNRRRLLALEDNVSHWDLSDFVVRKQQQQQQQQQQRHDDVDSTKPISSTNNYLRRRMESDEIVPGLGWEVDGPLPGNCDGTYTGICGRLPSSNCLLSGHMDARGGLLGNALSGWLVMNLKDVTEGLILLKMETWHKEDENKITKDWSEVNNGGEVSEDGNEDDNEDENEDDNEDENDEDGNDDEDEDGNDDEDEDDSEEDSEEEIRRELGDEYVYPDEMVFDYAIDGKITTLTRDEFVKKITKPQRVVEVLTILDDPEMAKKAEPRDMEVAIRLRNCGRKCTFRLTHVYWA